MPAVTSDALATHELSSADIHAAIGGAVHSGSSIYGLDADALDRAKPDLIITQELCDVCAVSYEDVTSAARLMDVDAKIVSLEPHCIHDILEHVLLVGRLTGTEDAAERVVADARARIARMRDACAHLETKRVVCIEWLDPIFVAGHWVPEQVEIAGGTELLGPRGRPSHQVAWETVIDAAPEVVVLMPCGMPIDRTLSELDVLTSRPSWTDLPAVRNGRVFVVDASSFFNRPGPRVVRGAEILLGLLHPEAHDVAEPPGAGEARIIPTP